MPRLDQLEHRLDQLGLTVTLVAKHRLNQLKIAVTLVALGQAVQTQGKEKGTSEAKRIHNAFAHRKKDLKKEPELLQHLHDLEEHHKKGSPVIMEYKKAIGECKMGKFDTPFLLAVKKRILTKKWGQEAELGSWKQVLDRFGHNVAYAALRQGTLPYVPHSLLLPGHGVKWPESHEFVLTKKIGNEHGRARSHSAMTTPPLPNRQLTISLPPPEPKLRPTNHGRN